MPLHEQLSYPLLLAVAAAAVLLWWLRRRMTALGPGSAPTAAPDPMLDNTPPVTAPPVDVPASQPATAATADTRSLEHRLHEVERLLTRMTVEPGRAAAVPTDAPPATEALRAEVYHLADAGQDIAEIARRLSIARGEVDLLLSLRQARARRE